MHASTSGVSQDFPRGRGKKRIRSRTKPDPPSMRRGGTTFSAYAQRGPRAPPRAVPPESGGFRQPRTDTPIQDMKNEPPCPRGETLQSQLPLWYRVDSTRPTATFARFRRSVRRGIVAAGDLPKPSCPGGPDSAHSRSGRTDRRESPKFNRIRHLRDHPEVMRQFTDYSQVSVAVLR